MTNYFGEPWDAPALDDAVRAPTPVGTPCGYCTKPIAEGERGFLRAALLHGADGEPVTSVIPWHRECDMAGVAGHVVGVCSCTRSPTTPEERYAVSCEAWNRLVPADLRTLA